MSSVSHRYCDLNTSEEIECNANSKCGVETPGLCWKREKETNHSNLESRETVPDSSCMHTQELHLYNNLNHREASCTFMWRISPSLCASSKYLTLVDHTLLIFSEKLQCTYKAAPASPRAGKNKLFNDYLAAWLLKIWSRQKNKKTQKSDQLIFLLQSLLEII